MLFTQKLLAFHHNAGHAQMRVMETILFSFNAQSYISTWRSENIVEKQSAAALHDAGVLQKLRKLTFCLSYSIVKP